MERPALLAPGKIQRTVKTIEGMLPTCDILHNSTKEQDWLRGKNRTIRPPANLNQHLASIHVCAVTMLFALNIFALTERDGIMMPIACNIIDKASKHRDNPAIYRENKNFLHREHDFFN